MSSRIKGQWHILKALQKGTTKQRRAILATCDNKLLLALCEILSNVLSGTIKLSPSVKSKLKKFGTLIRKVADKKVKNSVKKKILVQKGGFLPLVLAPALSLAATLLGEVITKL